MDLKFNIFCLTFNFSVKSYFILQTTIFISFSPRNYSFSEIVARTNCEITDIFKENFVKYSLKNSLENVSTGPSEGSEKWGVRPQKWGGKNQISAEICLFLTIFGPFLAKVGGQLTPLPPCFRRP